MKIIDYLRGWIAAAVAYVISHIAIGLITQATGHTTAAGPSWLPGELMTPWLVPAVLSTVAAIVAVRRRVKAVWWKWLILTIAVPTTGGVALGSLALNQHVDAASLAQSVLTHVALAGVLGVTIGTVLSRIRAASQTLRR